MTTRSSLPIEEKLARIDQWRASGLRLKDYVVPLGEDLGMWTAWLRWEKRWRGLDEPNLKQARPGNGFVKAVARDSGSAAGDGIRVVLRSDSVPSLLAQVSWPVGQELAGARWLREVFK